MSATYNILFRDFRRGNRKFTVTEMVISPDDAYPGLMGPATVQGYGFTPANVGMDVQIDGWTVQAEAGTYLQLVEDRVNTRILAMAPHTSAGTGGGQLNSGSTALANARGLIFAWGT